MERQQFSDCIDQPMDVVSDEPTVRMSVQTAINRVDHDAEEIDKLRRENLGLKSICDRLVKSLRIARTDHVRQTQSKAELERRCEIAETMVGELLLKMEMTATTGMTRAG